MTTVREGVDAVVVGGGIVGVSTALQLQRTGRSVMVIERGEVGDEASGHNGGMFSDDCMPVGTPDVIRSLPHLLRDPESPLVLRMRYLPRLAPWMIRFALNSRPSRVEAISTALYSLMSRGLDAFRPLVAGTEAEAILKNRGHLYAYRRRDALDPDSFDLRLRQRRGVTYEILDDTAMARLSPAFAGRFEVGIYFPKAHWTADPQAFTQTLLASFVANGGRFERAEVRGFDTSDGRVLQVRTDNGAVATGAVVIAAGPWSRGLLRRLGSDVPLDVERGYGADLPDPGFKIDVPIVLADVHSALTPHRTGFRLAGYDELASIAAPADMRLPQRLIRSAQKVFPELRADGAAFWMRRRPATPDSLPVIGRAPRFPNAYLAFGHGHKGLCMGAITGKLVQQLMDGEPTTVDVAPFRPTRFHVVAGL
ncbi:MAG: FAD-binding oxidoreductase [Chloroflexi bacterium]|nr:MAG: FAD-binding oxidoreductase [Chloroflexota bacterium]TME87736.1 MAG: FAD-binding oxidoreductase [Chloroflexota bacterium]